MTGLVMMLGGTVLSLFALAGILHWLYCRHKRRYLYGGTGR